MLDENPFKGEEESSEPLSPSQGTSKQKFVSSLGMPGQHWHPVNPGMGPCYRWRKQALPAENSLS